MSSQLRSLLGAGVLAIATACSAPAKPAPAAPGTVENTGAAPAHAGARAVIIKHGPMTYVMDTPRNQLEKAATALAESGLVATLQAEGIAVTYAADEHQGDTVIILDGEVELGRAELHDLDGKDAPQALLDAIHAHFAAR
jgi:hypothetical protein